MKTTLKIEDNLRNEANLKIKTILFLTENKIVSNGLNHWENIYETKPRLSCTRVKPIDLFAVFVAVSRIYLSNIVRAGQFGLPYEMTTMIKN